MWKASLTRIIEFTFIIGIAMISLLWLTSREGNCYATGTLTLTEEELKECNRIIFTE